MRLLDTVSGLFVHVEPLQKDYTSKPFKYAIMSHTWDPEGEQSYKQLKDIQKQYPPYNSDDDACLLHDPLPDPTSNDHLSNMWNDKYLSSKVREACKVARLNGYRYLWADWCCIDKSSSSELSESINSMYQWYALADVCYVFLPDIPPDDDLKAEKSSFRKCRWFTRGWTLQELIAPKEVVFFAHGWKEIGSKFDLGELIAEITKIDYDALLGIEPLDNFSLAQRFSWAADRKTTRVEDRAYSLLGILDINLPTLYGEGERAFRRLQEEIMRRTSDQTLFAWTKYRLQRSSSNTHPYSPENPDLKPLVLDYESNPSLSLLAPSLDAFSQCERIRMLSHDEVLRRLQLTANEFPITHYKFTQYGIRVLFPVIHFQASNYFPPGLLKAPDVSKECPPFNRWYLVILGCEHQDFPGCLLGRVCYVQPSGIGVDLLYSGYIDRHGADDSESSDLLPLSSAIIKRLRSGDNDSSTWNYILPGMAYIPHPPRSGASVRSSHRSRKTINLVLPKKNQEVLSTLGYTVTLRRPNRTHPTTHLVVLALPEYKITIEYQHTLTTDELENQKLDITANVTTSRGARRADQPGESQGGASWTHVQVSSGAWHESLEVKSINLEVPKRLKLSLGLASFTTNHYLLSIELNPSSPPLDSQLSPHQSQSMPSTMQVQSPSSFPLSTGTSIGAYPSTLWGQSSQFQSIPSQMQVQSELSPATFHMETAFGAYPMGPWFQNPQIQGMSNGMRAQYSFLS